MNQKSKIVSALFAAMVCMIFWACGGGSHDHNHDHETHTREAHSHTEAAADSTQLGPEYTSKYICTMHCEGSGSEEPGKCPVCGMTYVWNSDHHGPDPQAGEN